jgi:hypothetical protein
VFDDLSQFIVSDEDLAWEKAKRRQRISPQASKAKRLFAPGVRFIRGPVSQALLGQAWRLHHAAPLVLLAIKSEIDIQRWREADDLEVAVTAQLCADFGLSRNTRLRAVRALEAAGMLTASWADRRAPRVRLAPGLFDEGKISVQRVAK